MSNIKNIKELVKIIDMGIIALEKYEELSMVSSVNIVHHLEKSKNLLEILMSNVVNSFFSIGTQDLYIYKINSISYLKNVIKILNTGDIIEDGVYVSDKIKNHALKGLLSYAYYVLNAINSILENASDEELKECKESLLDIWEEFNELMDDVKETINDEEINYFKENNMIINEFDDNDVVVLNGQEGMSTITMFTSIYNISEKELVNIVSKYNDNNDSPLTYKKLDNILSSKLKDGEYKDESECLTWDDKLDLKTFKEGE